MTQKRHQTKEICLQADSPLPVASRQDKTITDVERKKQPKKNPDHISQKLLVSGSDQTLQGRKKKQQKKNILDSPSADPLTAMGAWQWRNVLEEGGNSREASHAVMGGGRERGEWASCFELSCLRGFPCAWRSRPCQRQSSAGLWVTMTLMSVIWACLCVCLPAALQQSLTCVFAISPALVCANSSANGTAWNSFIQHGTHSCILHATFVSSISLLGANYMSLCESLFGVKR